ncbi:MAG: hypothetical protein CMH27_02900 [Micavibrio sp.]|nr:hypothetical protein [Micavibrio sp.]
MPVRITREYMSFFLTKDVTSKSQSSTPVLCLKALSYCAAIAAISAYSMGMHYEDADPLFGGGTRVVDYVPSDQDRAERFWWVFLILAPSAVYGIHKAREFSHYDKIIERAKKKKH